MCAAVVMAGRSQRTHVTPGSLFPGGLLLAILEEGVVVGGQDGEEALALFLGDREAIVLLDYPDRVSGFLGYLGGVLDGCFAVGDERFAEDVPGFIMAGRD